MAGRGGFWRGLAFILSLNQVGQRRLVAIFEFFRLEVRLLALDNVGGEIEHVGGDFLLRDIGEIFFFVTTSLRWRKTVAINPLPRGASISSRSRR